MTISVFLVFAYNCLIAFIFYLLFEARPKYFPNDWEVVWNHLAIKEEHGFTEYNNPMTTTHNIFYSIYYSSKRNKYKIKITGYHGLEHEDYLIVLNKLAELNKFKPVQEIKIL